jgi:hypothetical protein
MPAEAPLLASWLYWAFYVIALAVAIPVGLALLFGVVQTARWFKNGGKANPHRHGR